MHVCHRLQDAADKHFLFSSTSLRLLFEPRFHLLLCPYQTPSSSESIVLRLYVAFSSKNRSRKARKWPVSENARWCCRLDALLSCESSRHSFISDSNALYLALVETLLSPCPDGDLSRLVVQRILWLTAQTWDLLCTILLCKPDLLLASLPMLIALSMYSALAPGKTLSLDR